MMQTFLAKNVSKMIAQLYSNQARKRMKKQRYLFINAG